MATFVYPALSIDTTGLATEAKQDTIIAELETANTSLTSLDGKDFATETTLVTKASEATLATRASETTLLTRASEATLSALDAKVTAVDTDNVTVSSSALPAGAATETTLASRASEATLATRASESTLAAQAADIALIKDRLAGSLVPEQYDYIALTYVTAGNGIGEVETAEYRSGGAGGSTVATLTLAYDANNQLSTVTRS